MTDPKTPAAGTPAADDDTAHPSQAAADAAWEKAEDDAWEEFQAEDDKAAPAAADGDEVTETETPEPPSAAQPAADDPWANADPQLKALFDAAQQRAERAENQERTARGRLSAQDRLLNQYRSRQPAEDPAAVEAEQELAKVREEYPEVVTPLLKRMDAIADRQAQQDAEQHAAGQAVELERMQPGWYPFVAERGEAFAAWVATQPTHVREAAIRNTERIIDASEAADVVSRFREHVAASEAPPAPAAKAATPPTLTPKRQQQLQASTIPKPGSSVVQSPVSGDMDEDQAWDYWTRIDAEKAKHAVTPRRP